MRVKALLSSGEEPVNLIVHLTQHATNCTNEDRTMSPGYDLLQLEIVECQAKETQSASCLFRYFADTIYIDQDETDFHRFPFQSPI